MAKTAITEASCEPQVCLSYTSPVEAWIASKEAQKAPPKHLGVVLPASDAQNICWSMDFVSDGLIDDGVREYVGLLTGHPFTELRLAETLDRLAMQRDAYSQ